MRRTMISQALLSLAIGGAAALAFSTAVLATPEIAQKEELGCLVCHTAVGRADLTDRGDYYRTERTLEGYPAPETPSEPESPEPPEDTRVPQASLRLHVRP
jgi:hypothetical protein